MSFTIIGNEVLIERDDGTFTHYASKYKNSIYLNTVSNIVQIRSMIFDVNIGDYIIYSDDNSIINFTQDNISESSQLTNGVFDVIMPQSGHTIITLDGATYEYHKYDTVWKNYETDVPRTSYENGTSISDNIDGFCCILDTLEDLKSRVTTLEGA